MAGTAPSVARPASPRVLISPSSQLTAGFLSCNRGLLVGERFTGAAVVCSRRRRAYQGRSSPHLWTDSGRRASRRCSPVCVAVPLDESRKGSSVLKGAAPTTPRASEPKVAQLNDIISERGACGVGFIANLRNEASHGIVEDALTALGCMEHRGGCGADNDSGDGSGLMTSIPWELFNNWAYTQGIASFEKHKTGVGMVFLPRDDSSMEESKTVIANILLQEGLEVIGWRPVPVNTSVVGFYAKETMPTIQQIFVKIIKEDSVDDIERELYICRKLIEKAVKSKQWGDELYICSLSNQTIVYKGMLRSEVLGRFYLDLQSDLYKSSLAIYHRRYSTNTSPRWPLAQPMRLLGHNGEINTIQGNLNWMQSREATIKSPVWRGRENEIRPYGNPKGSDSANLDSAAELLIRSGRSPAEALMLLVPEAYKNHPTLSIKYPEVRVGLAIYLRGRLFNHSCRPNAHAYFISRNLFIRSTEFIPAGCPVEISYGPQVGQYDYQERQKILEDQYSFKCQCNPCTELHLSDVIIHAFHCSRYECLGVVLKDDMMNHVNMDMISHSANTSKALKKIEAIDEVAPLLLENRKRNQLAPGSCFRCGSSQDIEILTKQAEKIMANIKEFRDDMMNIDDPKSMISSALMHLDRLKHVKHPFSKDVSQLEDLVAQAFCLVGELDSSLKHCKASLKILQRLYPKNHIAIGYELVKLASLQLSVRNHVSGGRSIEELEAIFLLHFGSHATRVFPYLGRLKKQCEQMVC